MSGSNGKKEDVERELLALARRAIESFLIHGGVEPVLSETPELQEKKGAFVTLEAGGDLRGCIGYLADDKRLDVTVQKMAIKAASEDPRFPPVTREELPEIEIEVSVLSPFREIREISEIQVGVHGLLAQKGERRGLLLPQVASREGWDRETFLTHTCLKAGLPPEAWREEGARIFAFSCEVFSEK